MARPLYEVECDENGLKVRTEKEAIFSNDKKSSEIITSMSFEAVTKVTETFLGHIPVPTNADIFPDETLEAKAKVRLAREEIERAMDALEVRFGKYRAGPALQLSATAVCNSCSMAASR